MGATARRVVADRARLRPLGGLLAVSRRDLPRELLAGVTLAALIVPLNIGYAQVAGLPAQVGLYTSLVPLLVFALLSSSRQLVGGPDASIAALVAASLTGITVAGNASYVPLAAAQALVCAVFFALFWWFRLGSVANFLSKAVLAGFVTGLGLEVLATQIPNVLGVTIESDTFGERALAIIRALPDTTVLDLALGGGTILTILVLRRAAPAIPGSLVGLAAASVLTYFLHLDRDHGVHLLGQIPSGLPVPGLPDGIGFGKYLELIPSAVAICAVTIAEALLIGRRYAQKRGYPLDPNNELFALGAANVASGLTGGLSCGTSTPRTEAMDAAGARTQVPSLAGVVVVGAALLFFTDVLAHLPSAALAGIVMVAVIGLIEVHVLRGLFRIRRSEFWIALVCLVSVLALGPLKAVVIAFLLSVVDLVRRGAHPPTETLGQIEGRDGFYSTTHYPDAVARPGVLIYRFGAPLYFANADTLRTEVEALVGDTGETDWVVLDTAAVADIDVTGAEMLGDLHEALAARGVVLAISETRPHLRAVLDRYGLTERIGAERIFTTNAEALAALASTPRQASRPDGIETA